ncbi:fetuin-B-like [Phyllobates terribilis]|uniref:fetuin-B-like n=1 Tax=Phyllobates terribilis TaxID=111132 RepID=UPI003CCAF952
MERIFVVAFLVSLCSATSPPHPSLISVNCNATEVQANLAVDLINEDRKDGFLFRPARIESVFQQESVKLPGSSIYYLDLDVIETDCHVLSGKSWKECIHDIPFHETVFGHCKAIIFIARPRRILKLVNYNCTLSPVPLRSFVHICPDCPPLVRDISPKIEAKADLVTQQFNKDSNETHYFKVDHIERVRTQYMFGQSYYFSYIIKETECLKTDSNVNLADCKFLKNSEAEVGFCKGSSYHTPERKEEVTGSCDIYDPKPDKDDHDHRHSHCGHGPDSSKTGQRKEKSDAPKAEETEVKEEGTGEAGQGKDVPDNCEHRKHGHCPHHGCRHHHHQHPHHHHRHRPHHHHHHHDHDHKNGNHSHDPSHQHHHHHHHHHNHTSSDDGSSSEEHTETKDFKKRSKGSVQFHYLSDDENSVPVPTIVRLPPPPQHPGKHGKHGKHDSIEFPSEHSKLSTCPGEPLVELNQIIKDLLFA